MIEELLETVFSVVERAFVRMQAGEVLVACLEAEDLTPIQKMVEDLVLAGPRSLNALREVRAEIEVRKDQLQEEITQQFSGLDKKLLEYEVNLSGLPACLSTRGLETAGFMNLLRQLGVLDNERQQECLHLIYQSKEAMSMLARQILLLEEMAVYLDDWMWGLIYQSAHQPAWVSPLQKTAIRLVQ